METDPISQRSIFVTDMKNAENVTAKLENERHVVIIFMQLTDYYYT